MADQAFDAGRLVGTDAAGGQVGAVQGEARMLAIDEHRGRRADRLHYLALAKHAAHERHAVRSLGSEHLQATSLAGRFRQTVSDADAVPANRRLMLEPGDDLPVQRVRHIGHQQRQRLRGAHHQAAGRLVGNVAELLGGPRDHLASARADARVVLERARNGRGGYARNLRDVGQGRAPVRVPVGQALA